MVRCGEVGLFIFSFLSTYDCASITPTHFLRSAIGPVSAAAGGFSRLRDPQGGTQGWVEEAGGEGLAADEGEGQSRGNERVLFVGKVSAITCRRCEAPGTTRRRTEW